MKRIALVLAATIALCGCSGQAANSQSTSQTDAEIQAAYEEALSGQNIATTFIGEPFYDGTIEDWDGASKALDTIKDRIGADDTTVLEPVNIRPTENGPTYYTFRQQAGDVAVYGASVKLIVNKDHKAVAAVSSILPNVKAPNMDTWAISASDAEKVVRNYLDGEGLNEVKILPDTTEQTLIPIQTGSSTYQYAWAVFTPNYFQSVHMPFVAHYVNNNGEYLYNMPVDAPDAIEAQSGENAAAIFDFNNYASETRTCEVTHADGRKESIEIPVLVDKNTNDVILADSKRKIVCGDYANYNFNNELTPTTAQNDTFDNIQLLTYYSYIRVWDFFDQQVGWHGPDGDNTPSLLLMNYVDENGQPEENAVYIAKIDGFQQFSFTEVAPYGDCLDIIGHEFTHCVTTTTMLNNVYQNDCGAINEGMSDIIGNLAEMLITGSNDGAWAMGDALGKDKIIRSMSDPHLYHQPEYVWDTYYAPAVSVGTELNDNGGVHTNSSLLNIVSYKLNQAGMKPDDQMFYWMNVALALTPLTDYPQLSELLPWVIKEVGQEQYVDTVKDAIKTAKYTLRDMPKEIPDGFGVVTYTHDNDEECNTGQVALNLESKTDGGLLFTWPLSGTNTATVLVPEGDYYVSVETGTMPNTTKGDPKEVHVESKETCTV